MNFYIISGLLIMALGTALGTGVIIYGQHVKSDEESRVVQDKIDNVLKRIDDVRKSGKDQASAGKIDQIEKEFRTWAADFLKNREQRKVELARTQLDSIEMQLRISNKWRPIFKYVIDTIESMVHAYNSESGENIKVEFPNIPQNLYSVDAIDFVGKIIFPQKAVWHIKFSSPKPAEEHNPPVMTIFFKQDKFPGQKEDFFRFELEGNKHLRVFYSRQNIPIEGIKETFLLDDYRYSLKEIIRHLFEAQLLS